MTVQNINTKWNFMTGKLTEKKKADLYFYRDQPSHIYNENIYINYVEHSHA